MKNETIVNYGVQHAALFVRGDGTFENIVNETDIHENPVFQIVPGVEYFAETSEVTENYIELENTLAQEIFHEPASTQRKYFVSLGIAQSE